MEITDIETNMEYTCILHAMFYISMSSNRPSLRSNVKRGSFLPWGALFQSRRPRYVRSYDPAESSVHVRLVSYDTSLARSRVGEGKKHWPRRRRNTRESKNAGIPRARRDSPRRSKGSRERTARPENWFRLCDSSSGKCLARASRVILLALARRKRLTGMIPRVYSVRYFARARARIACSPIER